MCVRSIVKHKVIVKKEVESEGDLDRERRCV